MHHVRVALDGHQLVDLDAAVLAHAPEVVAAEVDQHHVLGALLLVGEQLLGHLEVFAPAWLARGRVPAIGRISAWRPVTFSSGSGEAPAIEKSSNSRKYM